MNEIELTDYHWVTNFQNILVHIFFIVSNRFFPPDFEYVIGIFPSSQVRKLGLFF